LPARQKRLGCVDIDQLLRWTSLARGREEKKRFIDLESLGFGQREGAPASEGRWIDRC
jgi:hypothetical protein